MWYPRQSVSKLTASPSENHFPFGMIFKISHKCEVSLDGSVYDRADFHVYDLDLSFRQKLIGGLHDILLWDIIRKSNPKGFRCNPLWQLIYHPRIGDQIINRSIC